MPSKLKALPVRFSTVERQKVNKNAAAAGLSACAYVRRRALGALKVAPAAPQEAVQVALADLANALSGIQDCVPQANVSLRDALQQSIVRAMDAIGRLRGAK